MPSTCAAECEAVPSRRSEAFDRRATLSAAIAVATCASMTIGIFPLVLGMFADRFSLSLEQTGILATMIQAGYGIGGLLVLRLRGVTHWRALLLGASFLAAVLNGAAMFAPSPGALMGLQVLSSVAAGFAYGLAIYIVGRTARPERAFGLMYTAGLAAYSAFAAVFPLLRQREGFAWALNSLGALLLIAGSLSWWLPGQDRSAGRSGNTASAHRPSLLHSAMGLIALALFELGIFAVWAYTDRIGTLARLSSVGIGAGIAIGGIAGVAGAGTAAAIGTRIGRLTPSIVATAAILLGNVFFWSSSSLAIFTAGSCLFNYGWMLAIPYYMGAVVASDHTGSLTSLLLPMQTLGAVSGPLIAALVVGPTSTNPVIGVSTLACLAAIAALTIAAHRTLNRQVT